MRDLGEARSFATYPLAPCTRACLSVSELIIGSDSGKIFSFQVDSEIQSSKVWKPSEEYFEELKFPVGGKPVFSDLDKDGDLDMIIGSEAGTLHYFRNEGQ